MQVIEITLRLRLERVFDRRVLHDSFPVLRPLLPPGEELSTYAVLVTLNLIERVFVVLVLEPLLREKVVLLELLVERVSDSDHLAGEGLLQHRVVVDRIHGGDQEHLLVLPVFRRVELVALLVLVEPAPLPLEPRVAPAAPSQVHLSPQSTLRVGSRLLECVDRETAILVNSRVLRFVVL